LQWTHAMFFIDFSDIKFGTFLNYISFKMINETGSLKYLQNCGQSYRDRVSTIYWIKNSENFTMGVYCSIQYVDVNQFQIIVFGSKSLVHHLRATIQIYSKSINLKLLIWNHPNATLYLCWSLKVRTNLPSISLLFLRIASRYSWALIHPWQQ